MEKNSFSGTEGDNIQYQYDYQAPDPSIYPPQFEPPLSYPQQVPGVFINPNPYHNPQSIYNPTGGVPAPYPGQYSQPVVVPGVMQPQQVRANNIFGRFPVITYCFNCKANRCSRVEFKSGCFVWVMFFIFFFIFPVSSCLPFCINSWQDAYHICSMCGAQLGKCLPL